jgi:transcriptional regulator with XRE-family HTH domain
MKLGELILAWRKANGVSIRELAKTVGIHYKSIDRLERGRTPNCHTLAMIFCWLLDK